MPAEYLACKQSYIKKGISEKTASARCAAMYFKRHGVTVNEAHKRGVATFPDLEGISEDDFDLAKLILTDLNEIETRATVMKPDTHGEEVEISALNMDFLDDFGVLEITATKVGAGAFTAGGQAVSWTERALKKAAPTWVMGNVSVNHNGKFYGRIIASWLENGLLKMVVKVNDQLKGWLKKFGKDIGVSIEAISVKLNKKFEVVDARGTGVTFVFPPEIPACTIEEGCGIVATETEAIHHTPPEGGSLPEEGKKILDKVYNSCRVKYSSESTEDKTRCSKIAWSAVHNAGFSKDKDGNWAKATESPPFDIDKFIEENCNCEEEQLVEGVVTSKPINLFDNSNVYKDVTFSTAGTHTNWTLNLPPTNISEENKNKEGSTMDDASKIKEVDFVLPEQLSEDEKTNLLTEIDGAKLSYQERKNLPDSSFCGPDRSFPAQDAAHVRNGLARLPQAKGLSSAQRAAIHSCLASRAKKYGIDVSSTVVEEVKGETMVEEKPAETICAKKHEAIVKAKDSEIEAKVKEIETLKATVAKFEAEKKAKVLETFVKETGLDAKTYESKDVSVLEDIMATLKLLKEKENKEPEVNSGAVIKATEQQTKPEGDVVTTTLSEAEAKAKAEAAEVARINAKATEMDGKKR
jgi:cation transport regulator ChaB